MLVPLVAYILLLMPSFISSLHLRLSKQIVRSTLRNNLRLFSTADTTPPLIVNELSLLEIRVGRITEISRHPEAESLYVEKVDCGEAEPRTIVSGLVQFCTEQQLLNSKVIVLCNLKPRSIKNITSHGMLLCGSNEDHTVVVPLRPPDDTPVGEMIMFDGYKNSFIEPGNRASKAFSKITEGFFVNDNLVATYEGVPFKTTTGLVTCSVKGKIS